MTRISDSTATAPPEGTPVAAGARAPSASRSAALVTAGILVSRLAGLVRQRVIAHYFGTSAFADVIAAAFRVGNVTQNLLGEGTLSASFIPVYARLRAAGRAAEATRFALSALGLLVVVVAAVSALGVLAAPWLAAAVAAGFPQDKLADTTEIVRIVFPMTGLLVVSAWGLGVLNAHRRFFLSYAAPVLWSASQIVGIVLLARWLGLRDGKLALVLAWSALVGAGLQLVVLLAGARRSLGALVPRLDTRDENVREAASRLPAALAGRGVIQLSGLVDTFLVSFLGTGALAVFGYAQTIFLLPMSVLGTGEAAAALPEMAGEAAEADLVRRDAALQERLGASLARVAALAVPAAALLAVFGGELVRVLLQTGSFDRAATAAVVPLLVAYGAAVVGNAGGRVLSTTCFALGDTRTPARLAVLRVAVSTAVALALLRPLGVLGVVIGAVLAGWIEAFALGLRVRGAIGGLGLAQVPIARILALGALSVAAGLAARTLLPGDFAASRLGALVILAAFGLAFAVAAPLLGLLNLRALLRRR